MIEGSVPIVAAIGASLLAFLGLLAGHVLSKVAEEEIQEGVPYFRWLRIGIGFFIIWFTLSAIIETSSSTVIGGVVSGISMYVVERFGLHNYIYAVWGAALGTSLRWGENFTIVVGLVFLFGLVESAMRFESKEIFRRWDLLFIPLLLVLLFL